MNHRYVHLVVHVSNVSIHYENFKAIQGHLLAAIFTAAFPGIGISHITVQVVIQAGVRCTEFFAEFSCLCHCIKRCLWTTVFWAGQLRCPTVDRMDITTIVCICCTRLEEVSIDARPSPPNCWHTNNEWMFGEQLLAARKHTTKPLTWAQIRLQRCGDPR